MQREIAAVVKGKHVLLDLHHAGEPPAFGRRNREEHLRRLARQKICGGLGQTAAFQKNARHIALDGFGGVIHQCRRQTHRLTRFDNAAVDTHIDHSYVGLRSAPDRQQIHPHTFRLRSTHGVRQRRGLHVTHDVHFPVGVSGFLKRLRSRNNGLKQRHSGGGSPDILNRIYGGSRRKRPLGHIAPGCCPQKNLVALLEFPDQAGDNVFGLAEVFSLRIP